MAAIDNRFQVLKDENVEEDAVELQVYIEDEALQVYIDQLPNHLLQRIIDRIYAMDLRFCWYVSKAWRGFVRDSYITKLYGTSKTILNLSIGDESKLHRIIVCSLDFDTRNNPIDMKIVNQYKIPNWFSGKYINSCNSLLSFMECRGRDEIVYILNPMTGEYMKLPELEEENLGYYPRFYGFGISKDKNKYKMLRIRHVFPELRYAEICVLHPRPRNMKWKFVDFAPYPALSFMDPYVYFDGALHWIANDKKSDLVIISCFDFALEKFRPISLPLRVTRDSYEPGLYTYEIGVLGENLYFLHGKIEFGTPTIKVWFMKTFGVNCLWSPPLVIQVPMEKEYEPYVSLHPVLSLIKVYENGEILMARDHRFLVFYDPVTKNFRDVELDLDKNITHFSNGIIDTLSNLSLNKLLFGNKHVNHTPFDYGASFASKDIC